MIERNVAPLDLSVRGQGNSNVPSVSVWLALASIASTSYGCSPEGRDATNSGGTVTLVVVAGTVTWNEADDDLVADDVDRPVGEPGRRASSPGSS